MSLPVLKIAVVGHTNTGKTSLLRTLTRDTKFGEVSNRPATTRHVEGTSLLVNGRPLIELYDTPGLEDSMGLLEFLDTLHSGRRLYGIELITRFLGSPAAHEEFEQEAKALRQVLSSDISLYVIDVRDRVLGKHRDELEILASCTKPIVPVLNFIVSSEAKTTQWREHLARMNIHAVVEFDTVILDEYGERRLFEKMQTLLDHFYPTLQAVIEDRQFQRARLNHASADLLADLLIDVAAYKVTLPLDTRNTTTGLQFLRQLVREREQQCVDALLELYRFHLDDYAIEALPIDNGHWGMDLFNPASMKQFGIRAGGGAAAGGMAGLAVDAMAGGASLGAGAAIGAAIGALWSSSRTHGKRLADRVRGFTELRVNDETLRLLAVRQIELVQALLRRGHASRDKIRIHSKDSSKKAWMKLRLPAVLEKAKVNPAWSCLNGPDLATLGSDSSRLTAKDDLARIIEVSFSESMTKSAPS
jgi:GTPase SAR1 family protein